MYDLGHSPLYDPIFAMKDAHVADDTGTQCGNDHVGMIRQGRRRRAIPGTSSFRARQLQGRPEMVAGLKAGYDKLAEHGWLNWMSCQPQVNTCIPKMGECCASSNRAAPPTSTPSSARCAPIGSRHQHGLYRLHPAACPSTCCTHLDENRAAKCIVELDDGAGQHGGRRRLGGLQLPRRKGGEPNHGRAQLLPKEMGPTATRARSSPPAPRHERPGYAPDGLYAGVPDAGGHGKGQDAEEPDGSRSPWTMSSGCSAISITSRRPASKRNGGHRHLRLSGRDL